MEEIFEMPTNDVPDIERCACTLLAEHQRRGDFHNSVVAQLVDETLEIWRDTRTGDRYVVKLDYGRPGWACGPLTDKQAAAIMAGEVVEVEWSEELADDINEENDGADVSPYEEVWPSR